MCFYTVVLNFISVLSFHLLLCLPNSHIPNTFSLQHTVFVFVCYVASSLKIIFSSLIFLFMIISINLELVYCVLSFFPKLRCAVFNLVPRARKLGVEVTDLRLVNLFTPFLSPVLPYLWPDTFLLEDTLVSTSEQLTWLNFV
jgi:hypothetical protein